MTQINFTKYTANGNTFVIVDETLGQYLPETSKAHFAYIATNQHFGVGADGLIFLQKYSSEKLNEIASTHRYQYTNEILALKSNPDYIFRMFEPDSTEALCCGNGLLCVASYLHSAYGITNASVLTEIPTNKPQTRQLGYTSENLSWVNMGTPSRIPDNLVASEIIKEYIDTVGYIPDYPVNYLTPDADGDIKKLSIQLSGYITYTGEPHLVIFDSSEIPTSEENSNLLRIVIGNRPQELSNLRQVPDHQRIASWLFHQIGLSFNSLPRIAFPFGINVDFARVFSESETSVIEYRCFERGINQETLACGTGAVAVSEVATKLGLTDANQIIVRPLHCRSYPMQENAQLHLERNLYGDWLLEGKVSRLFAGTIM